jgi:hypothetical protein
MSVSREGYACSAALARMRGGRSDTQLRAGWAHSCVSCALRGVLLRSVGHAVSSRGCACPTC